jgi:hypothetical protein
MQGVVRKYNHLLGGIRLKQYRSAPKTCVMARRGHLDGADGRTLADKCIMRGERGFEGLDVQTEAPGWKCFYDPLVRRGHPRRRPWLIIFSRV